MLDCFETAGSHAFVWGPRGVGKTSLAHTACEEHSGLVKIAAAIACEKNTTFNSLLNDILRSIVHNNKVLLKDRKLGGQLSAYGINLSSQIGGFREKLEIDGPNHAVALLNTIFDINRFPDKVP